MHISAKCSLAVHCLLFIHEYGETVKVTSDLLSRSTGVNPVSVRNIMSALKKSGILHTTPGTGGATLARPPREINLYQICVALEPDFLHKLIGVHPDPSPLCPVGRNIRPVLELSYDKVRRALEDSAAGITLADILEDYHRALEQERQAAAPEG